jgi:hypothetical protein
MNPLITLGITYPNIIVIQGLKFNKILSNIVYIKGKINPGNPLIMNINNFKKNILILVFKLLFVLLGRGSGLHPGLYSYLQNSPKIAPSTILTGLTVTRSSPSFLNYFEHFFLNRDTQSSCG